MNKGNINIIFYLIIISIILIGSSILTFFIVPNYFRRVHKNNKFNGMDSIIYCICSSRKRTFEI